MATGRLFQWWGNEAGPAAGSGGPANAALTASSTAAPTNGNILSFRSRDFDGTADEYVFLYFALPSNYVSGGTLNFSWLTTATTGNVIWKTAWALVHPSTEGTPTDLDAAVFGAVTSQAASAAPGTAGYVKQQSYDLGITGAHAGDLLAVYFGRDADNASDTLNAIDAKVLEPWFLSFVTT